jgi:hypothetical protein
MTFKQWLIEAKAIPGPTGDLIIDLKSDDELPDVNSAAELTAYIKRCGACSGALQAVPKVWALYQQWLRTRGAA